MKIFVGADHAGFALKEKVEKYLRDAGYDVEDDGALELDPNDDYPQFAYTVATRVLGSDDEDPRGILVCGGGQGMAIAANRVHGIRAAVIWDAHEAERTREDNNANIISLPARVLKEQQAYDIIDTFLKTPFSDAPRHARRVQELDELF